MIILFTRIHILGSIIAILGSLDPVTVGGDVSEDAGQLPAAPDAPQGVDPDDHPARHQGGATVALTGVPSLVLWAG